MDCMGGMGKGPVHLQQKLPHLVVGEMMGLLDLFPAIVVYGCP